MAARTRTICVPLILGKMVQSSSTGMSNQIPQNSVFHGPYLILHCLLEPENGVLGGPFLPAYDNRPFGSNTHLIATVVEVSIMLR